MNFNPFDICVENPQNVNIGTVGGLSTDGKEGVIMVITIGGEYGCGSKEVAEYLAKITGYKFCDDEIVTEALKDFGVDTAEQTFKYYDESMGNVPIKEIEIMSKSKKGIPYAIAKLQSDVLPLDQRMDNAMRGVQSKLADEGNCILIGRCANYYLRGRNDVLSLFFADTDEAKVKRISSKFEISEKEAEKLIKKTDKRRADFYSYFTGEKWDDPDNYDIRMQTGALGEEKSAEAIAAVIRIIEG